MTTETERLLQEEVDRLKEQLSVYKKERARVGSLAMRTRRVVRMLSTLDMAELDRLAEEIKNEPSDSTEPSS